MHPTHAEPVPATKSTNVRDGNGADDGLLTAVRFGLRTLGAASPSVAGRVAGRLFTWSKRHPLPEREVAWLADAMPLELTVDGVRTAGQAWGDGPAILLVHGWGGRGSQLGALAAPLVARGFRVVAFDGPGHGASKGLGLDPFTFARTIRAWADYVGPVHGIAAHSFGCLSTTIALEDGLRVQRLAYIAPPPARHGLAKIRGILDLSPTIEQQMYRALERRTGSSVDRLDTALFDDHDEPLLVVMDDGDREVVPAFAAELVDRWDGAVLHRTEGLGHTRVLRDPSVVERVSGFLATDRREHPLDQFIREASV